MRCSSLLGVLGALMLILGLWACPPPSTAPPLDAGRQGACENRLDCPAGEVCTADGYCNRCATSGQCSVKEVCVAGTRLCALREGWGTDCAANEDCQAGSWCHQGLCQGRSQVSLCPGRSSSECPKGDRCNRVTSVCEEDLGCSTNDDCSPAEVCNTGMRQCVPRCTTETQAQFCAALEHCVINHCAQCSEASECGAGLLCDAAGQCSTGSRCYTDRDCPVPLVCLAQTGACLPKPPPCLSDDTCAAGLRCDVTSGRCVPRDCQSDRYEPNDDEASAFNVAPAAYHGLTLCPRDADWYAIPLARGDQLGVNLDADPFSEAYFSTLVRDRSGRTLASGRLLASYVAPAAATYFVVVSASSPSEAYGVTFLKARGTPCDDDAHEPNDTAAQPTQMNRATELDGVVCPQDQDWFRLATIPDAGTIRVALTGYESGNGLLSLCVFSADGGTQLGCSSAPLPAVTVQAESGLLVRVVGDSPRIANTYTLVEGLQ